MDLEQLQDQELVAAYARLGTALAPPVDVAARVEKQVADRRRRRRTAVAGGTAVVLAAGIAGAVVATGGDDGRPDVVATDPGSPDGSFTLTRADGSAITFDDLDVRCGRDPLGNPAPAGTVFLSSPVHLDATGDRLTQPYFFISASVGRFDDQTLRLPYDRTEGDSGLPPMIVFAAESDQVPGQDEPNEVSSAQGGASGTVHVVRAACDPVPVLEVVVDTTLSSESNGPSEKLVGSFR
jgi:hypothetical protein